MGKINSNHIYYWVDKVFKVGVIAIISLIVLTIFYNGDLRGVESNVIYSTQMALESNQLLYESPEKFPFHVTQYSPLYYVISDGVISSLAIETNDFFTIRIVTRIISILLLTLSLFVIKDTLEQVLKIKKKDSLIIVLAFLIISFPWFNLSRPDVLVLLFFALSIRSILLYITNGKNRKTAILLGVFLALGVMSKLTMGLYIISFGLYMLITRQWRLAFISATSFIISLIFMGIFVQILNYDLTYIYNNIVEGVDNGADFWNAWEKVYDNYFNYYGIFSIIFILLSIVYFKNWKKVKTNDSLFFLIIISYFVAVVSFFSAVKIGSALNYFNELLLCLLLFMISFLQSYHLDKKKLYLIGFMLFGMFIAYKHTFAYKTKLTSSFSHSASKNEIENDVPKIIEFLDSNLGDSYFYSQIRDVAQTYPLRCILFSSDIHAITYERQVYNYSFVKEWAKNNLRFIIVTPVTKELFGIDINKYYYLKIEYQQYHLYELKSYKNE